MLYLQTRRQQPLLPASKRTGQGLQSGTPTIPELTIEIRRLSGMRALEVFCVSYQYASQYNASHFSNFN